MKKVCSVFALLLCIALVLSGCGGVLVEKLNTDHVLGQGTSPNDVSSQEYKMYLDNGKLQLYINPDTTELRLVNKADNSVWNSTNVNKYEDAGKALLHLTYTSKDGVESEMNSFENAVAQGQYSIEADESKNTVDIKYSIGDFSSQILIPEVITKERYDELYSRFDDEFEASQFQSFYTWFSKDEVEDAAFRDNMLGLYSILKSKDMYVVSRGVIENPNVKKQFGEYINKIGYTKEMYEEDSKNFSDANSSIKEAGFIMTLRLTLDGSDMVATIPNDSIEMFSDYPLTNIYLLKYFGSPNQGESGYLVLPDGSGSIMNLYNGKTDGHEYSTRVYGNSYSLDVGERAFDYKDASLPYFGMKRGNSAFFAQIEAGDTIADVKAYSGDSSTDVCFAAASFRFRETYISRLSSGRREAFNSIQKNRYSGDISVRYSFLTGEQSTYNGMAEFYRNQLFSADKKDNGNIGLYIEYIGLLSKQAQIFGIKYDKKVSLTNYKQVADCTKELSDGGLTNLNVRYSGWFNNGFLHTSLKNVKLPGLLGGKDDFNDMISSLSATGATFWPDADVQYTVDSSVSSRKKSVITISKKTGEKYDYDLALFSQKKSNILSQRVNILPEVTKELNWFMSFANKYSLKNLSLRDLGLALNANFDEDDYTDSNETMNKTVELLESVKKNGSSFITNGANKYVLNYANTCLEVPLSSNEYDSCNYSIPFLMMVMRGKVSYTGEAVNLSGDAEIEVLRAAQTGAGLYYTLGADNTDEVVDSDLANYFSINYDYYKDTIIKTVKKYQSDFAQTAGQTIKSFTEISSNVTKTVFANQVTSIVNMNNYSVTVEGVTIPAKTYIVTKG